MPEQTNERTNLCIEPGALAKNDKTINLVGENRDRGFPPDNQLRFFRLQGCGLKVGVRLQDFSVPFKKISMI